MSSGKSQHCRPAFVLPLSPPGIELLPYTFSSLKPLADPSLSAVQELFLPPSLKTSACSLIVLCISVQFSLSVMFHSLLYRGVHHARLPCTSLTPRACSDPCLSSHVPLFAISWGASCQASLYITNSQSLLRPMFIKSCSTLCYIMGCIMPGFPVHH